jgi:hypothetical protein
VVGRYSIDYKDSNGKRIFKTVEGNERDALRQRNQILERMNKGERVVRSNMTVKELGEEYLRQTTRLKDSTITDYGYALDHWVYPRLGNMKVSSVTVNEIADFIAEMRQEFTANTIRNCLKPLAGMFRVAVRRGWVAQNPVHALDRQERPHGASKRMRILSSDEIKQLLAVSAEGYRHRNRKVTWARGSQAPTACCSPRPSSPGFAGANCWRSPGLTSTCWKAL